MKRKRILLLPSWYPDELSPVKGIFIQDQAKAISLYHDVVVLYVYPLPFRHVKRTFAVEHTIGQRIRTIRVKYADPLIPKARWLLYPWIVLKAFSDIVKPFFMPDLVHAHVTLPAGLAGALLSRRLRVPLVISEHMAPFTHLVRNRVYRRAAAFALRQAKLVLPVSLALAAEMERAGVVDCRNKVKVIPNAVDTQLFYPDHKMTPTPKKKDILVVAALERRKGIDVLLQAISILSQKREDFVVTIIGGGQERSWLEGLSLRLGVQRHIRFLGEKPKEQVAQFMRDSAFLVLPSLHETFGVVLAEAMACGKPVVATRCGGPEEIVTADTGLLVPPKDISALAHAIDFMLDHHHEFDPQKIASYAHNRFSFEAVGKKLSKIYEEVTQR